MANHKGGMTDAQREHLKKAFLLSFRMTGNISESCEVTGIGSRNTIRSWQEHDEEFSLAYKEAEIQSTERLETEARRRAVDGVTQETPVYSRGQQIGSIMETKYSDTLLIFLLKARDPAKYRERVQLQHADADGQKLPLGAVEEFVRGALTGR